MTKRSIQSLGAQEVDVTVIPADLFRQDLSNPDDPILDFQDRAIRARRLESPKILATERVETPLVEAETLVSTAPTGTTPLILTSTTKVNNLNADMLDGFHASIFATADALNTHASATTGIHGATSTDTPNTLVTRDNNGGTTLRALQLKRPDGTTYLDATGGLVKLLDRYGFNLGTSGYRTVKTYTQFDAKPAMILLAPVYTVTSLPKTGFMGTVYRSRGSEVALNISEKYDVICVTAYNAAKLVCTGSNPDVRIVKTTYNNTGYYALYFPSASENRITLDGLFWGDPIEISDATGYPVTEVSYNLGPYSIVETGSNSNGNWIKFSDGWMICYGLASMSNVINSTMIYDQLRNFPASFIETPMIQGGQVHSHNDLNAGAPGINFNYQGGLTSSTFRIGVRLWSTFSNAFSIYIAWTAIGRWKQ